MCKCSVKEQENIWLSHWIFFKTEYTLENNTKKEERQMNDDDLLPSLTAYIHDSVKSRKKRWWWQHRIPVTLMMTMMTLIRAMLGMRKPDQRGWRGHLLLCIWSLRCANQPAPLHHLQRRWCATVQLCNCLTVQCHQLVFSTLPPIAPTMHCKPVAHHLLRTLVYTNQPTHMHKKAACVNIPFVGCLQLFRVNHNWSNRQKDKRLGI